MRYKLKGFFYFLLNLTWMIFCYPGYLAYRINFRRVKKIQSKILFRLLRKNKDTDFGLKHKFVKITTIDYFQKQIPLSTFEDYLGYLDKIKKGQKRILTKEPILRIIPTSGSTSASKFIPFTRTLKQEFSRGINPWMFDLYHSHKQLLWGKAYWSITPSGTDINHEAKSSIPVEFGEEGDYFNFLQRIILKFLLVVPAQVNQIKDIGSFRYLSLLFLIRAENLRWISVWNPMFLILILKDLENWFPRLLGDLKNSSINPPKAIPDCLKAKLKPKLKLPAARIKELEKIYEDWLKNRKISLAKMLWPKLTLISCWVSGNAQVFIKQLKELFPESLIQPKGLIATEGFVSLPLADSFDYAYLAVNSHFFEFIELENNKSDYSESKIKLAWQLQAGKKYSLALTTGAGLYRYNLQDIVEVVGFKGQIPLIRFLGKFDYVSDLMGEKLNAYHVERILGVLFRKYEVIPEFYLVAPEKFPDNSFAYTLFIKIAKSNSDKLNDFIKDFEDRLSENIHYSYCRRLGQLEQVKLFAIDPGSSPVELYLINKAKQTRKRLGDLKVPVLDREMNWSKVFSGIFISPTRIKAKAI